MKDFQFEDTKFVTDFFGAISLRPCPNEGYLYGLLNCKRLIRRGAMPTPRFGLDRAGEFSCVGDQYTGPLYVMWQ